MFRHRIDFFFIGYSLFTSKIIVTCCYSKHYFFEGHSASCPNLPVFHPFFSFQSTFPSPKVHDVFIILKQNFLESLFLQFSKHKNKSLKSHENFNGGRQRWYNLFAYCFMPNRNKAHIKIHMNIGNPDIKAILC